MGNLEDFQGFGRQLDNELSRLDHFHEDDRPYVKRFIRKWDARVKPSTLAEYLKNLRSTAGKLDGPLVELDELALDEHVYDLRHNDDYGIGGGGMSDGTVRNHQFVIRKFLSTIDIDGTAWADDYDLITPEISTVSPDDMLNREDIRALVDAAPNLRDIALIEFLADTGARLSLVGSLRVGDVSLDGEKATYRPNPNASGLKGASIMDYPIIDSRASLRAYLNQTHPRPNQDDVALFHHLPGHGNDLEGDGALRPNGLRHRLETAADAADVEKPVNPHNFRHSAITRMRREGYTRSEIEHRVHWKIDTDMWMVYEHISGEQHNEAIWERAGVVEQAESETDPQRQPCGNCRELLAPHHEFCPNCGEPVSPGARRAQDEVEGDILDELVRNDLTTEEREVARKAVELLRTDPEVQPSAHD